MSSSRLFPVFVLSALLLSACGGGQPSSSAPSISSSSSSDSKATSFTKKATDLYLAPTMKQSCNLYFTADQPDIAFVDMAEISFIFPLAYGETFAFSFAEDSSVLTISHAGVDATLDFNSGIYSVPDFETFYTIMGKVSYLDIPVLTAPNASGKNTYLERVESTKNLTAAKPITFDLSAYQIPYYAMDQHGYLPLATYSDLFYGIFGVFLAYNTEAVFLANDIDVYKSLYYSSALEGKRSSSLANFTYHEFCFSMDHNYGLQGIHGISSFDDFITRSGYKADMLSLDPKVSSLAYSKFILGYLDDSHSGATASSYLAGSIPLVVEDYYGPSMRERSVTTARYQAARKAAYPSGIKPYEVVGNTAFITFDEFATPKANYYANKPTEADAANDTFALVAYSATQIASNSAISNVVVDLSLNGGGAADAATYILSWMLGGVTLHTQDAFSGAKASLSYYADVNLDGVFDSSDFLTGKHVYCLTSPHSFSCGNLVPAVLKEEGSVTLLDATTGGGACIVGKSILPDGTAYQLSSRTILSTRKNGSYYSVDQGVVPDVAIPDPATFYDRTALVAKIASL
jgi:hypothetical protein